MSLVTTATSEAFAFAEELPSGEHLVIGLNPPFGKNGQLANKFINKAAEFHPRVIVLIVPPATIIPQHYKVVYEDTQIMSNKAFYIPGGNQHCQSWNLITPAVRILVRENHLPSLFSPAGAASWAIRQSRPVGAEFAHLMPPPIMMPNPMMQGPQFPMPLAPPWHPMPVPMHGHF